MDKAKTIALVKDTFCADDARNLLYHLLHEQMKFHHGRSFSQSERFGVEDEYSGEQIQALKQEKQDMLELMQLARLLGTNVKVKATIEIELTPEEATVQSGQLRKEQNA